MIYVILLLALLLIAVCVLFFNSTKMLKSTLEMSRDELYEIYDWSEDASNLVDSIDEILSIEVPTKAQKKTMRALIKRSRRVLVKTVPCFSERGAIPSLEERFAEDSKCTRCNASCPFNISG